MMTRSASGHRSSRRGDRRGRFALAKRSMTDCTMAGNGIVVRSAGFAGLEEDVRILRSAANDGAIGRERVLAELR